MTISAKKCVSLNLSLIGCLGPIDSTSYTHSGSSILSSTLTDRSFLPPRGLSCLSDSFLTFFYAFLMLSLSLPQLDASRIGKWMPTTVCLCHSGRVAQRDLPAGQKNTKKGLSNEKVLRWRVGIF